MEQGSGSTGSSVPAGCPTVDEVGLDVVRASRVLFPVVGLDADSPCPPKSKKSSPATMFDSDEVA